MKRLLSISFLLLILSLRAWAQPTMTEDTLQLKNAVVYGKSRSQQLREGAFSVNAVDVAAVASQVTSVTHIVNRTSGIRVRTEGGLGSDFDGIETTPAGLSSPAEVPNIFDGLRRRGYSEERIADIAGQNFLEYYRRLGW